MDIPKKEQFVVDTTLNKEPAIGQWIWAIQDARQRTMEQIERLNPDLIDWLPLVTDQNKESNHESSIGTILYHIADIEADWLYYEVFEQSLPPEVAQLFPYETRDEQGYLTQVQGFSLEPTSNDSKSCVAC